MKKRILMTVSVMFILALGLAAYAFTSAGVSEKASMECCCKGGSCPMKSAGGDKSKDSCCDMADCCCKKGDSCPMMKKGDAATAEHKDCCVKAAPKTAS